MLCAAVALLVIHSLARDGACKDGSIGELKVAEPSSKGAGSTLAATVIELKWGGSTISDGLPTLTSTTRRGTQSGEPRELKRASPCSGFSPASWVLLCRFSPTEFTCEGMLGLNAGATHVHGDAHHADPSKLVMSL